MGIQKLILNIILTIEAFFLKFLRIKENRVTLISLESNTPTFDFKLIYNQLDKTKYDVCLCLIQYEKNLKGQFLYFLNCLKQLYYIYTSHLVILNDNNYAVSHFKRKGVIVLQIWHACGAIKKFGNAIEREYPVSNYDYVISTSSYWKKPYSEAFGVKEDNVIPTGMPRNDELFSKEKREEYSKELFEKYPYLKNKKIILYAPTFRGNIYKGFRTISFDALQLINQLSEDFVILYKYHPLLGNYQLPQHERIINMNKEDTHQLFCISDYLISDYSSIIFDFMILEKPIIFFVPDLKEYMKDIGTFVDIEKLGCPICYSEEEILHKIQNQSFDINQIKQLKKRFFDIPDENSTKRVVELIENLINHNQF